MLKTVLFTREDVHVPELKKIRVREAKPRDIGLFKKLWAEHLEASAKAGSIIAATEKTLDVYVKLFNMYLAGDYEGVVLFVADKGVLMYGDAGAPLEHVHGRMVTDWGHYSTSGAPEGLEDALQTHAQAWAVEHGFDGVLVDAYGESKHPAGFTPVITVLYKALEKE
jgi:hypothetical protein